MAQQAIPTIKTTPTTAIAIKRRWATFRQSLFFVAGFGTFIVGLNGLVGALGDAFFAVRNAIPIIGGIALIVFGFFTMKLVNIPFLNFLNMDTRKGLGRASKGVGAAQSYLTGLSFAAGWTPCIGPFLGAILTLSVDSEFWTRFALLIAYTLGLGIPFLLVALMFDRMTPLLTLLKRNMRTIEIVSGALLIIVGLVLLSGQIAVLSRYMLQFDFALDTKILGTNKTGAAPTIIVAALAGFLSFASPCVLPLVPAYLGFIGGWAVNSAEKA